MRAVDLKFLDFGGDGFPIVILHGLFGSSRNWGGVGRALADLGHVYALDQRNHGDSPHAPTHTLSDLTGDLDAWLTAHGAQKPVLLGHSMGGLVAMQYALRFPDNVRALIVVDIAPRNYEPHHQREFAAFRVDISGARTRDEVDRAMAAVHPDQMIRQFLQMNLLRTESGYQWKINVDGLEESRFMEESGFSGSYGGPALFVAGAASPYVEAADHRLIMERFPQSRIDVLAGADHYLHYTAQAEFLALVRKFLGSGTG